MMHPSETEGVKHVGRSEHRLSTNERELTFSQAWKREQERSHILQWLLCASMDQQTQDRDLTQPEATCAATLMQWLGSPVGFCWLDETLQQAGYRLERVRDGGKR